LNSNKGLLRDLFFAFAIALLKIPGKLQAGKFGLSVGPASALAQKATNCILNRVEELVLQD
jgi:hypothetical protein